MALEGDFAPIMLYVNNLDKPGFIGALGAMLGEAGVNIATFHLGRTDKGGEAIALVGIDSEPADAVMTKLSGMQRVRYAKVLHL